MDPNEELLLHKHLTMLCPAFNVLKMTEADKFIDAANDCLTGTPFMFVLFGDGVGVACRIQMYRLAQAIFDPYVLYDKLHKE